MNPVKQVHSVDLSSSRLSSFGHLFVHFSLSFRPNMLASSHGPSARKRNAKVRTCASGSPKSRVSWSVSMFHHTRAKFFSSCSSCARPTCPEFPSCHPTFRQPTAPPTDPQKKVLNRRRHCHHSTRDRNRKGRQRPGNGKHSTREGFSLFFLLLCCS